MRGGHAPGGIPVERRREQAEDEGQRKGARWRWHDGGQPTSSEEQSGRLHSSDGPPQDYISPRHPDISNPPPFLSPTTSSPSCTPNTALSHPKRPCEAQLSRESQGNVYERIVPGDPSKQGGYCGADPIRHIKTNKGRKDSYKADKEKTKKKTTMSEYSGSLRAPAHGLFSQPPPPPSTVPQASSSTQLESQTSESQDGSAQLMDVDSDGQPPLQLVSHFQLTHPDRPNLSRFEVLLTIYTPILESLSNHLDTHEKLKLTHVSSHLRRLCHSYPSFWANPDFHLDVNEGERYDAYGIGKVYNLDALLSILPFEGRLVSLNVDWTAITGHYLFKIVDKCAATLQHLSVRGCRKVSIKHHIVPHFVHQSLIEPYSIAGSPEFAGIGSGGWGKRSEKPYRALKSLHAWKARGVRRKPFLIDRKEADGDEPTRYLTLLATALNIFVDVGLCSTPKLRCPRRREITRRMKEKFCVPFDRRWRESNPALTEMIPSLVKRGIGRDIQCDSCRDPIPERCEACAVVMHCSKCAKTLCHSCSWNVPLTSGHTSSGSSSGDGGGFMGIGGFHANIVVDNETDPTTFGLTPAMKPCCVDTLPFNPILSSRHGDIYCEECYDNLNWGRCDGCQRTMCMQHEWARRRICSGGCNRSFCFPSIGGGAGPNGNPGQLGGGAVGCDMGGVRECVSCGIGVCGDCRRQNACNCQLCLISFYCRTCWDSKPFSCEGDLNMRKNSEIARQYTTLYGSGGSMGIWTTTSANLEITAANVVEEEGGEEEGDGEEEEEDLLEAEDEEEEEADNHETAEPAATLQVPGTNDAGGTVPETTAQGTEEGNNAVTQIRGGDSEVAATSPSHAVQQHLINVANIHERLRQHINAATTSDFTSSHAMGGESSNTGFASIAAVAENLSLLVLDDDDANDISTEHAPRTPPVQATDATSPGATTPLTPRSHTRSNSLSGGATPVLPDLLDAIGEWDVVAGPSLL
ncbi:hypothetical protein DFH27DRAFT_606955 [Peziza echinospora]|nr:hypothetical protein DFH27DRAFT_606955 [Peziza echinospora]